MVKASALMVVEGPNQCGAPPKRHLEAYDIEINTEECTSFAAMLEWPAFRAVIMEGEIAAGTVLQRDGLYIYSEEDLFGEPRARRRATRRNGKGALLNLEELRPDDVVVHIDHGIGRYRGLKHLKVADAEGDFLNLEYSGNDTMYVPVERINLVQRYVLAVKTRDGTEPKLDKPRRRLYGIASRSAPGRRCSRWPPICSISTRRAKWRRATRSRIQAATSTTSASASSSRRRPTSRPRSTRSSAILSRSKPMDRLICGDAGFGKTEVALRAAFMCVMDGRQVAILRTNHVILAEQHLEQFLHPLQGLSGASRDGVTLPLGQGEQAGHRGCAPRRGGHRHRHASLAAGRRRVPQSWACSSSMRNIASACSTRSASSVSASWSKF